MLAPQTPTELHALTPLVAAARRETKRAQEQNRRTTRALAQLQDKLAELGIALRLEEGAGSE